MTYSDVPIFRGLTDGDIEKIKAAHCFSERTYRKNEVILRMGERTSLLGIVKSGDVHIENIDLWGNKIILSDIPAGQVFGETYALTGEILMINAVAVAETSVCFLDIPRVTDSRFEGEDWYLKLLRNLMLLFARKNLVLSNRIFHTSPKHVRARLQYYLSACSVKAGSAHFTVPFDRQQLADYLNLDRSAMSKELGRMKEEGMLDYYKNQFYLRGENFLLPGHDEPAVGRCEKNVTILW